MLNTLLFLEVFNKCGMHLHMRCNFLVALWCIKCICMLYRHCITSADINCLLSFVLANISRFSMASLWLATWTLSIQLSLLCSLLVALTCVMPKSCNILSRSLKTYLSFVLINSSVFFLSLYFTSKSFYDILFYYALCEPHMYLPAACAMQYYGCPKTTPSSMMLLSNICLVMPKLSCYGDVHVTYKPEILSGY